MLSLAKPVWLRKNMPSIQELRKCYIILALRYLLICYQLFWTIFCKAQKDRILIKGGIVVNDDDMIEADVFIESGLIKWVESLNFL